MKDLVEVEQYLNEKYIIRENLVDGLLYIKSKNNMKAFAPLNENSLWRELCTARYSVKITDIINLLKSDFTEKYDPILDYFAQFENRAIKRDIVAELCKHIKVKGNQVKFVLALKKHLVRAVASIHNHHAFNKHCFVFVSSKQNNGKSTLCRWLCPFELKNYYAENITTDKDSLIALSENFLINLDELSTLMRSEINSLKSIFSKDSVKVRKPYERKPQTTRRRATFFGSTNRNEFLNDESGSVRWICFEIDSIDWDYKKEIDVNDLWHYCYQQYKTGFDYNLVADEIQENEIRNSNYNITFQEEELIAGLFHPALEEKYDSKFMTATQMMIRLQEKYSLRNALSIVSIGKALTKLNFERTQKFNGRFQEKGYWVIEHTL